MYFGILCMKWGNDINDNSFHRKIVRNYKEFFEI